MTYMPTMIYIRCLTCSSQLTKQLQEVDYSLRNLEMEEPYLPNRSTMVGMIHEDDRWGYFNTPEGAYVTNLDANINASLTDDIKRLYGCCGPAGLDGPNLICNICGSYVATRIADCGTPQCVTYDPKATSVETIQEPIV